MRSSLALLFIPLFSIITLASTYGQNLTELQQGKAIEASIGPGQMHSYTVSLDKDSFLQLVVNQRGIDVVVKASGPGGESLGEFDTPNGDEGPEEVSLVAATGGTYTITVAPLDPGSDPKPGRYEIKIVELRAATEMELKSAKNAETAKLKAVAMLSELEGTIQQLRSPFSRVRSLIMVSQLLFFSDEKYATKLLNDAVAEFKEYITSFDSGSQEDLQKYATAGQLRIEIFQVLSSRDPDMALSFLRSTRGLLNPATGRKGLPQNEESALEIVLANQITTADPKKAFQIAEETLKTRYSPSIASTISRLRTSSPELAGKLASDVVEKLQSDKLLLNSEAGDLAMNLIRINRSRPRAGNSGEAATSSQQTLLPDQVYRTLLQKLVNEALSYPVVQTNRYSQERNSVFNILNMLKQMGTEVDSVVPNSSAAIDKKVFQLGSSVDPEFGQFQKYQTAIESASPDSALETIGQAPKDLREQLYQQLANRVAQNGDLTRAKQIINDNLTNEFQRRQALTNLEQQAMFRSASKGKIDEALRNVSTIKSAKQRAMMISQIAAQIGPGQKKQAALNFLEQARGLLSSSAQAEDYENMTALLALSQAFARYDSNRAFEIIVPLIDQLNLMCDAARTLDGFGQQSYEDGELALQNGNTIANLATQITNALAMLAVGNFDRAKTEADRLRLPEVRLRAYLDIAQKTISPQPR